MDLKDLKEDILDLKQDIGEPSIGYHRIKERISMDLKEHIVD